MNSYSSSGSANYDGGVEPSFSNTLTLGGSPAGRSDESTKMANACAQCHRQKQKVPLKPKIPAFWTKLTQYSAIESSRVQIASGAVFPINASRIRVQNVANLALFDMIRIKVNPQAWRNQLRYHLLLHSSKPYQAISNQEQPR
jgi:predicted peptidase